MRSSIPVLSCLCFSYRMCMIILLLNLTNESSCRSPFVAARIFGSSSGRSRVQESCIPTHTSDVTSDFSDHASMRRAPNPSSALESFSSPHLIASKSPSLYLSAVSTKYIYITIPRTVSSDNHAIDQASLMSNITYRFGHQLSNTTNTDSKSPNAFKVSGLASNIINIVEILFRALNTLLTLWTVKIGLRILRQSFPFYIIYAFSLIVLVDEVE